MWVPVTQRSSWLISPSRVGPSTLTPFCSLFVLFLFLYDEFRRRTVLAGPKAEKRAEPVRMNDWNDYRIRCDGKRIQLWINGVQTVDYTEQDPIVETVLTFLGRLCPVRPTAAFTTFLGRNRLYSLRVRKLKPGPG